MTTGLTFLDVEKAFDGVWSEDLIYKMDKMGCPRNMVQMVDSFITGRMVRTRVGSELSG